MPPPPALRFEHTVFEMRNIYGMGKGLTDAKAPLLTVMQSVLEGIAYVYAVLREARSRASSVASL